MPQQRSLRALRAAIVGIGLVLAAGGGANSAGIGQLCGGFVGQRCDAGLWCDPRPAVCKGSDVPGKCVRRSRACHLVYRPVCGCNGKSYGNDCHRIANSTPKRHVGRCQ